MDKPSTTRRAGQRGGSRPGGPQSKHLKRAAGPGRPKGSKDRLTKMAELVGTDRKGLVDWFKLVSETPAYRENLLTRIGLAPASAMERLLAEHVYGKPVETHKITGDLPVLSLVLLGERKDPLAPPPLPEDS